MRRIGQEEEVEGHGLQLRDGDGNDWVIADDRVQRVAWRGTDGMEHELEGLALKRRFARDSDVEGHGYRRLAEGEEDVEGHGYRRFAEGEEDVEGHGYRRFAEAEEDAAFRVTYIDDDGNEQDVEGHMPMRRFAEGDEDVEGHGYRR
jgi:hypothetical protein